MAPDALVATRPSTDKFGVQDEVMTLEVCAVARPRVCMINRVLMLALLSRGVAPEVMWRRYQGHVAALEHLQEGGLAAMQVLPHAPTYRSSVHACSAVCIA